MDNNVYHRTYLPEELNCMIKKLFFPRTKDETVQIDEGNHQLNAILQSVSNGLIILKKDKSITFLNEEAKNLFYNPHEVKYLEDSFEHTIYSSISGTIFTIEDLPFEKIFQGFSIKNFQIKALRPDKAIYFLLCCHPIYDSYGNINSILLNLFDNTDKVEIKQHLADKAAKEKSTLLASIKMKDEFLSVISHEFKTPLTVINSALQMMEIYKEKNQFEKALKYTENIKRNVFRQLRLVNNLLDITKANAKCLKVNKANYDIVFLTRSITQFVLIYANQKGVNLVFDTKIESYFMEMDEEKFERILLNLLSNAIKFTPQDKNIFVKLYKESNHIYIAVKDEGIGIPRDKQNFIFQRFGQVDSSLSRCAEGTGIGLSLVKLLIKQLGGKITLVSQETKGSTFTISLPLSKTVELPENSSTEELSHRLVQIMKIEFSDIYLP